MRQISPHGLTMLKKYEEAWQDLYDILYNDLADPDYWYDDSVVKLLDEIIPRPKMFPSKITENVYTEAQRKRGDLE